MRAKQPNRIFAIFSFLWFWMVRPFNIKNESTKSAKLKKIMIRALRILAWRRRVAWNYAYSPFKIVPGLHLLYEEQLEQFYQDNLLSSPCLSHADRFYLKDHFYLFQLQRWKKSGIKKTARWVLLCFFWVLFGILVLQYCTLL